LVNSGAVETRIAPTVGGTEAEEGTFAGETNAVLVVPVAEVADLETFCEADGTADGLVALSAGKLFADVSIVAAAGGVVTGLRDFTSI
jgi:hypothetical protein